MSPKRLSMAALVTVAMLTASAFAQSNELTGIIGRTFISNQGVKGTNLFDNNVHFGKGLTFEINYGRHIWGEGFTRVTFEVPAVINMDEDLNFAANSVPASYQSYFVTPSLRANIFATTAISPWISAGGGFGHFRPADHLEFGGASGAKSSTTGVMQIGIGLDVRLKSRFTLRGEARDFWSGTPDILVDTGKSRQHNYLVGGGVVWRFGK
ncbi:MAG TPA: hypothetical protein VFA40_27390 [Terriglobales bacterium]|nr:hypothetical protein [Terriglobales bacterium]